MKKVLAIPMAIMILAVYGCQTMETAKNAADLDVSFTWSEKSGCSGVSPAMSISGIPQEARFLKINLIDHDAPGFNHGGATIPYHGNPKIPEGALPKNHYTGPCPPVGSHRYEFIVKALDSEKAVIIGQGSAMRDFPE